MIRRYTVTVRGRDDGRLIHERDFALRDFFDAKERAERHAAAMRNLWPECPVTVSEHAD